MSKKPMNNERPFRASLACSPSRASTKNAENDTLTAVEPKPKTTARYDRISELAKPKFISKMDHNKEIVCVRQPSKSLPANKSVEHFRESSSNEVKTVNSKCATGNKSSMSMKRPGSICSQKTFVKTPSVNTIKAQLPSSSTVSHKIAWLNSRTDEQSGETSVNNDKSQPTSKGNFSAVHAEHSLTQSGIRNIPKSSSSDFDQTVATDAGDTQIIVRSVGVVATKPAAGDRDSRLDSKISFSEYLSTNENIKKWQKIHTDIVTNEMNEQPESLVQDPWSRLKKPTKLGGGNIIMADSKISQQNPQENRAENAADECGELQGPYEAREKKPFVQPEGFGSDQEHREIVCESRKTSCADDSTTSSVEYPSRSNIGRLKNRQDAKFILSAENIKILKRKFAVIKDGEDNEKAEVIDSCRERRRRSENQIVSNNNCKSESETTRHFDNEQQQQRSPQQIENVLFDSSMWVSIVCCLILMLFTLFYHPSDVYDIFK